jgi:2-iminobutanoate/2-iminopropanoate deaminase
MSELTPVHSDRAPRALGPYSQAIVSGGWVFCSGQIPLDPGTGELSTGDVREQTELVLRNLAAVLEAAGSALRLVTKTTVFLADMGDFTVMNEVYARHFGEHRPARSTVQVAALPRGCSVEIECVARVAQPST